MIKLTALNGKEFYLNCELIEKIEERPDTTIFMMNGDIFIVKESAEEVVRRVIHYKREIFSDLYGER